MWKIIVYSKHLAQTVISGFDTPEQAQEEAERKGYRNNKGRDYDIFSEEGDRLFINGRIYKVVSKIVRE